MNDTRDPADDADFGDDRDAALAALFATPPPVSDDAEFTARVMTRTRFAKTRRFAPWLLLALCAAGTAWYLAVPYEFARLVAIALTTTLVDLGEGWVAWVLAPVNSVAALLALGVKFVRVWHRRFVSAALPR